mmetsp:Transcript_295/g.635  ORF Transcript_295/g.635 Transcript_295/m.635 type:complete len:424 (-) Transcript_295:39-1310(-)
MSLGLLTCFIVAFEYKLPRNLPRCLASSSFDRPFKSLSSSSCKDVKFSVGHKKFPMTMKMKREEENAGDDASSCWVPLNAKRAELRLDATLICGQSFRWKQTGEDEWTCVISDALVSLKQTEDDVLVTTYMKHEAAASKLKGRAGEEGGEETDVKRTRPSESLMTSMRDYFGLSTPLEPLYNEWSKADAQWGQLAVAFPGLRVLRQDPVECLFSFICSSNNNIARITLMIDRLCSKYGKRFGRYKNIEFFSFPKLENLAKASEEELRALGLGYRSKYVHRTASFLVDEGGEPWLFDLRNVDHKEAQAALQQLHGVGAKVADCVCLFSLDKPCAIPVDTHVWQITVRELDPSLAETKSLTPKIYQRVGDLWRSRYGEHAGWAHTILFAADLSKFKTRKEEALGVESDKPKSSRSPKKKQKVEDL